MIRQAALGLLASAAVMLAIFAAVPSTDDFSPENPAYNGLTAAFSSLNATAVAVAEADRLGPGTALLIVGPDRPFTPGEADAVLRYVEGGGLLLIADDFGTANALLQAMGLGARFNGSPVLDPIYMFKNPALPVAMARLGNVTYSLYLNYPTYLEVPESRGCLAFTSLFSYVDVDGDGRRGRGEPAGPLCVAYFQRLGAGAVYLLADPSVFINAMWGLGDNEAFVRGLLEGRAVYVASDVWNVGTYARARSQALSALYALLGSTARYPLAVALSAALYLAAARLRGGEPRRARAEAERVAAEHPHWDRATLERLARELYGEA